MKKEFFVIFFTILFISILYMFDQIFKINYLNKVIIKLVLMIISFLILKFIYNSKMNFIKIKNFKNYKSGIYVSVFTFLIIFIGFFIIKDFLNLTKIKNDFFYKYNLKGISFFIASFYLIFINALLEEYFFRGFILQNFRNKKFASVFSALSFSIYHLANFINWFSNKLILIFPLIGLFIAGLLFNFLAKKTKDIYNSYIPHLFADLSIVIIGYYILFIS
ncbi:MAG: CPBP family intramembrane glutamic endopeptidase [Bacillota bacterium]